MNIKDIINNNSYLIRNIFSVDENRYKHIVIIDNKWFNICNDGALIECNGKYSSGLCLFVIKNGFLHNEIGPAKIMYTDCEYIAEYWLDGKLIGNRENFIERIRDTEMYGEFFSKFIHG